MLWQSYSAELFRRFNPIWARWDSDNFEHKLRRHCYIRNDIFVLIKKGLNMHTVFSPPAKRFRKFALAACTKCVKRHLLKVCSEQSWKVSNFLTLSQKQVKTLHTVKTKPVTDRGDATVYVWCKKPDIFHGILYSLQYSTLRPWKAWYFGRDLYYLCDSVICML